MFRGIFKEETTFKLTIKDVKESYKLVGEFTWSKNKNIEDIHLSVYFKVGATII